MLRFNLLPSVFPGTSKQHYKMKAGCSDFTLFSTTRMGNQELSGNSSSLTGQSREYQKQAKALLTSLAKYIKLRSSLDRMGPSQYTAGEFGH